MTKYSKILNFRVSFIAVINGHISVAEHIYCCKYINIADISARKRVDGGDCAYVIYHSEYYYSKAYCSYTYILRVIK